MRISLNLSTAEASHERFALAWAVPAVVLGLAGLVLLNVFGVRQYRAYRADRLQVADIQRREAELRGKEADVRRDLEKPAYGDLLRQVSFVNTLIDSRNVSLTELVGKLAQFVPKDARLTTLALVSQDQDLVIRFTIAGKSEDAVEALLNALEDSPNFKDVSILNQGFSDESSQAGQIAVVCTARYVPGAH